MFVCWLVRRYCNHACLFVGWFVDSLVGRFATFVIYRIVQSDFHEIWRSNTKYGTVSVTFERSRLKFKVKTCPLVLYFTEMANAYQNCVKVTEHSL